MAGPLHLNHSRCGVCIRPTHKIKPETFWHGGGRGFLNPQPLTEDLETIGVLREGEELFFFKSVTPDRLTTLYRMVLYSGV